jgi:hypothetical protein
MKKKTRKKVVRRKRRSRKSMSEKRVMQIKRGLMKSAKKLRLGAKRTGAYVYGTLRRIVGNRGLLPRQQKMLDFLQRFYPQYSELARDSTTKKDTLRLARLKLIKVRSFKRTGTYRGKPFSMTIMEARAMAPKGGQLSSPALGLARNPARTDKAHFGYAKNGMELLGTGLKIKKGERVYMTPATNIPGGGFFVEPAYPTGLWKQGSGGSILIKPKDFDDEITYVEPRGEYRPTPQVKPDYKYGIYTGRGIARNPMRSSFDKPTFGPGQAEYRRVDTTTMAGMKEAERLQRAGWYQAQVTPFSTTYYRRKIRKNPPMYAHGMMSHRTHGLSLKQMMKLYRLVSSGNPKAVMFARRTLGIPMSESLSQVKAVVYHHILDLKGKI